MQKPVECMRRPIVNNSRPGEPVFLRDRKDTACGAVARPMRYFDLAAKVVGPPGQGR